MRYIIRAFKSFIEVLIEVRKYQAHVKLKQYLGS